MKIRSLLAISAVLVCCGLSAATVSAANVTFSDVNYNDASGQAIKKMTDAGYLKGYPDGTFKPDAPITRAELTTVFNSVFGYKEIADKDIKDFTDNTDTAAWYYNAVRIAQSNGYINGFNDNTFRPQSNFTREQTSVVIALAGKLENKEIKPVILDDVSPWALEYVNTVINNDIIPPEAGLFRAKENITRAEVCKALAHFVSNAETTTAAESKSEMTTASATTEKASETTTKKEATTGGGGSSGGSSSGGSGSGSNHEANTESTTTSPADDPSEIVLNDRQKEALKRTITTTKNVVLLSVSTDDLKDMTRFILDAMNSYYDDSSYDIISAAEDAKSMYKGLSEDEKTEFQDICTRNYNLSDIAELQDIFGPILGL